LAPCAVSMIGDMFPPDRRGRPISIYLLGQSLAGGLSVMLTGWVLSGVPAGKFAWIGALDGLAPWRVAFLIAGVAGLPVILMLLSYREPIRRGARLEVDGNSLIQSLGYLRRNWILFLPYYASFAMLVMMAYTINTWGATYLMREFSLLPAQIGKWQGSVGIVLGTSGALAAGLVIDWLSRRSRPGVKLLFLIGVSLLMIPATLTVFMPSPMTAIAMLGFVTFFMPVIGTAMVTSIQEMVPINMRGIGVSLFGLFNTITGQTIGPFLVAALAARGAEGAGRPLGLAITTVCLPAILIAAALYAVAYVGFRRLLRRDGEFAIVFGAGG
jgi:MFS family permease